MALLGWCAKRVFHEPRPPLDTREFAAQWHSIVEQHVVTRLADLLPQLVPAEPGGPSLAPEQWAALARHLGHALQAAATSNGGLQAAVQHLEQVAAASHAAPGAG